MKFHIYVFRHGQTTFNKNSKFTGLIDAPLSASGIEDAKIVALRLKGKKIGAAFYTKLRRSRDSLKEVLKFHPECKKEICDDRMIERDYGKLAGKTHFEVVKKYGFKKYDKWHRGFDSGPPSGESFADVEIRVREFVKYLINFIKENKVNIVISAHGNSIRLFRKIMEGASEKEAVQWYIPYDNYYEYVIKV